MNGWKPLTQKYLTVLRWIGENPLPKNISQYYDEWVKTPSPKISHSITMNRRKPLTQQYLRVLRWMVLDVNVLTSEVCITAMTVLFIIDRKLHMDIQRSPIREQRTHFQQNWYSKRVLVEINVTWTFLLNGWWSHNSPVNQVTWLQTKQLRAWFLAKCWKFSSHYSRVQNVVSTVQGTG